MDRTDPRYVYYDYQRKQFASEEELTDIQNLILKSGTSIASKIASGAAAIVVIGIMFVRSKVISDQMELKKQGYEIARDDRARDPLDRDPLDAVRRPSDGS